jgi:cytoskeletal protein CcmA (bactofilin family)
MFKKTPAPAQPKDSAVERVTSVLGPGITWTGNLGGKGGIRIEGTFEGEIIIRGLVVIGETGRLTCKDLKANNVIVAGAVKGNIFAEKLEIRATGRVWGDVVTTAFSTEEGAFLRGQVRMEDQLDLNFEDQSLKSEDAEKIELAPSTNELPKGGSQPGDPDPTKPIRVRKIAKNG